MRSRSRLSLWYQELRVPFFMATIVPVLLGSVIAWERVGVFHWGYFFLAFLGALLLQAGTNVANDYFDYRSGADEVNTEFLRPYTGGSRMIQRKLMTPRAVLLESLVLFGLAVAVGGYLWYAKGVVILYLGLVGLFSGFFYTAPPFKLTATGLGELFVGVNFGVLMTLGAYYVQAGALAWEPVFASIPVALLIAGVLYMNQFQDYHADRQVGKTNLVVRLGRRRASYGYVGIIIATYLGIVVMVAFQVVSPFTLLAGVTVPIALKAVRTARRHYDEYLRLAPANSATIMLHLLVGLLLTIGYGLDKAI